MTQQSDPIYGDARLVELYDQFDGERDDLDEYERIIGELAPRRIADLGCGTGALAVRLAPGGYDVIGVDPAAASIDIARAKPGADAVRWIVGDATVLESGSLDLVVMTGNAAQGIVDDSAWSETLDALGNAIRPGGHFVFETRVPERRAWEGWTPEASHQRGFTPDGQPVETWNEVVSVELPLITFVAHFRFPNETITSTSILRFRSADEITADLATAGFRVADVRDAPDRPGREWIFIAERTDLR